MRLRLPTGGMLVAPTDPTQDGQTDCSQVFGFLPAVASYLASTQCLFAVLELVSPLTDVVNALGGTPELATSAAKFSRVAAALVPCELASRPASTLPFVRDLLCVVLRALDCLLGQLKSLVALMTSLTGQLQAAQTAGNADLVRALEAAQKNAQARAANVFPSIEAVQAVLALASVHFASSGIDQVQLPSAPAEADLNALAQLTGGLAASAASLRVAVDALGGC